MPLWKKKSSILLLLPPSWRWFVGVSPSVTHPQKPPLSYHTPPPSPSQQPTSWEEEEEEEDVDPGRRRRRAGREGGACRKNGERKERPWLWLSSVASSAQTLPGKKICQIYGLVCKWKGGEGRTGGVWQTFLVLCYLNMPNLCAFGH